MNKHQSILDFMEQLKQQSDFSQVSMTDYFEDCTMEIQFEKGRHSFYLRNYPYVDTDPGYFDFDLELYPENLSVEYTTVKQGEKVPIAEAITEAKAWLCI